MILVNAGRCCGTEPRPAPLAGPTVAGWSAAMTARGGGAMTAGTGATTPAPRISPSDSSAASPAPTGPAAQPASPTAAVPRPAGAPAGARVPAVLGVDVGTSSTKGTLVALDGTILAAAVREHSVSRPAPGHVEMDAEIWWRSKEHTSELQSRENLVCRLLLEKKKIK